MIPGHYVKEIKFNYVQNDFCKLSLWLDKLPCPAPAVGTCLPPLKLLHHRRDFQISLPPGVM